MRKAEKDIRDFIKKISLIKLGSQSALSVKSGKTRNQVSEFLTSKRDVNLLTFLNYLEALNCTLIIESNEPETVLVITPDDIRQTTIKEFT